VVILLVEQFILIQQYKGMVLNMQTSFWGSLKASAGIVAFVPTYSLVVSWFQIQENTNKCTVLYPGMYVVSMECTSIYL
jgi:hypothetical protein